MSNSSTKAKISIVIRDFSGRTLKDIRKDWHADKPFRSVYSTNTYKKSDPITAKHPVIVRYIVNGKRKEAVL